MSIWECINYLVQFFSGRCQSYSFSVIFTFICVHNFWYIVPCLSAQVLENSLLCVPQFSLCLTSFSLSHKKFITYCQNNGEELWVISFRREGGACLSSTVCKKSQYWLAFSTDENSDTLESSSINDRWSMLAIFLSVLYNVWGLKTEKLKWDLVQLWSDSCVSVEVDFLWMSSPGLTITQWMIWPHM